jgi:hypothetical protein
MHAPHRQSQWQSEWCARTRLCIVRACACMHVSACVRAGPTRLASDAPESPRASRATTNSAKPHSRARLVPTSTRPPSPASGPVAASASGGFSGHPGRRGGVRPCCGARATTHVRRWAGMAWRETDLAPAADERLELLDQMERRVQHSAFVHCSPSTVSPARMPSGSSRYSRAAREGGALSRWRLDIRSRRA